MPIPVLPEQFRYMPTKLSDNLVCHFGSVQILLDSLPVVQLGTQQLYFMSFRLLLVVKPVCRSLSFTLGAS